MHDASLEPNPPDEVRAGLVTSMASIAWTALTSAIALGFGIRAGSVVLVAFGAVGLFDLAGSVALVAHFRHAMRHDAISERHERVAHLVVSYGMLTVGIATLVGGAIRLAGDTRTHEPALGLVVSAASIVVLAYLGIRKRRIGRRIPSEALVTDGSLSLTGSGTAVCAVGGLALNESFGWTWPDPIAAMCVAVIAITLAIMSLLRA